MQAGLNASCSSTSAVGRVRSGQSSGVSASGTTGHPARWSRAAAFSLHRSFPITDPASLAANKPIVTPDSLSIHNLQRT